MSPNRLLHCNARRICVIKPSAFGDVVQALPLLPVLRAQFPEASISWVINRELSDLLQGHPDLEEIISFGRHGSWRDWVCLLRTLKQRRFDLVFDLQGLLRTGVMTFCTNAPLRVGLETSREGAHWACHHIIPNTGRNVAAHARYWRVAEELGQGDLPRQTIVTTGPQELAWTGRLLTPLKRPVLVVHPGARWVTKRWPVEKFVAVSQRAVRDFGFSVIVLGSDAERNLADEFTQTLHTLMPNAEIRNLAGKTNLKQLAALLQQADVLLTNDSGPMHLAAGLGTAVLGLFTCTDPQRSGPPGDRHELVSTNVACAGTYAKQCPHQREQHLACLRELDVDRVWSAFVRLMNKSTQHKAA